MLDRGNTYPFLHITPKGLVDLVDDVGSHDGAVVEAATVESLESLLATSDSVEFGVDVAVSVRINSDVDNVAVLLVELSLDLDLKLLGPLVTKVLQLPVSASASN